MILAIKDDTRNVLSCQRYEYFNFTISLIRPLDRPSRQPPPLPACSKACKASSKANTESTTRATYPTMKRRWYSMMWMRIDRVRRSPTLLDISKRVNTFFFFWIRHLEDSKDALRIEKVLLRDDILIFPGRPTHVQDDIEFGGGWVGKVCVQGRFCIIDD